jgi:preprotein translocase subunit SecD
MTSRSIAKASVKAQYGGWVVEFSMAGHANSALWDKVLQQNFHQFLGIELDGVVYSAPLIQPAQSSFSTFAGRGEISGSLTRAEAAHLAKAMTAHKR